jgi:hypothetical protein
MNKKITISVGADGQAVTVEVDGWIGPTCQQLTANLEAALGKAVKEQTKDAFFQRPTFQDQTIVHKQ